MKTFIRLFAWCALGAGVGGLLPFLPPPSNSRSSNSPQLAATTNSMMPMGITAALQHQARGAVLVDLRAASPHDLLVPDALRVNLKDRRASLPADVPVIFIGQANQVADAAKRHRVAGWVPAFTLKRATAFALPAGAEVSVAELAWKNRRDGMRVLDLREADEFAASCIAGSERVSMFEVASRIANRVRPVALFCATGHRSAFVVWQLRARGFSNVVSVRGGWLDWKAQHHSLIKNKEGQS